MTVRLLAPLAALAALLALPVAAQERIDYGPFYYDPSQPDRLYFDGVLADEYETLPELFAALREHPSVRSLYLNSPGGDSAISAAIADIVRTVMLDTVIPDGSRCHSGCAQIFFAGIGRAAHGTLGVHQATASHAQYSVMGPYLNQLICLGGAPGVVDALSSTPPEEMHIFDAEEIVRFGINRSRKEGLAAMGPPRGMNLEALDFEPGLFGFGDPMAALYTEFDLDTFTPGRTVSGSVSWMLEVFADASTVRADISFKSIGLHISLVFFPLQPDEFPLTNWGVLADDLPGGTLGLSPAIRLSVVDAIETGASHPLQFPLGAESARVVSFPAILSETSLRDVAEADTLYLVDAGENAFQLTLPKGEPGREAFAEWLPAMEALCRGDSPRQLYAVRGGVSGRADDYCLRRSAGKSTAIAATRRSRPSTAKLKLLSKTTIFGA